MPTPTLRALGARPRPPDPREWQYRLTPPKAVDRTKPRNALAAHLPPVMDQGSEGSCTANSIVCCAMTLASVLGVGNVPLLSREWDYYQSRLKEGTFPKDSGAQIADAFDVALAGLPPDSDWPYDANPAGTPPANVNFAGDAAAHNYLAGHQPLAGADFIDGMLTAFDNLQPVSIGLSWLTDFDSDWDTTGILSATPTGTARGGHDLTGWGFVPATGSREMLIAARNSWGATSPASVAQILDGAQPGDCFIPASLFNNGPIWEVRAAVGRPQPEPKPLPDYTFDLEVANWLKQTAQWCQANPNQAKIEFAAIAKTLRSFAPYLV